jgi:hypothetical protein
MTRILGTGMKSRDVGYQISDDRMLCFPTSII